MQTPRREWSTLYNWNMRWIKENKVKSNVHKIRMQNRHKIERATEREKKKYAKTFNERNIKSKYSRIKMEVIVNVLMQFISNECFTVSSRVLKNNKKWNRLVLWCFERFEVLHFIWVATQKKSWHSFYSNLFLLLPFALQFEWWN